VDFVKHGHYLLVTGSESQRTFVVVDVADPRRMKVAAGIGGGHVCGPQPLPPRKPSPGELLSLDQRHRRRQPCVALRVYRIERLFLPRLVATVDLSDRLDAACVKLMKDSNNWYPNAEMIADGSTVHTSFGTSIAGFDLSDPEKPAVLYSQKMPAYVAGLAKVGRTLYVAVNSRVRHSLQADPAAHAAALAIDVSDLRQPRIVGQYHGMDVPERMAAEGRLLYLVGEEKTPPESQNLDGVPFTKGLRKRFPRRIVLDVLGVSSPAHIVRKSRLPFPYRASHYEDSVCRAMALDKNVLYLADQDYGVHAVDASDRNAPQRIGSLRLVSHEVRRLIPDGKRLYVANDTGINAADISDPRHPRMDPQGSLSAVARWGVGRPEFGPNPRYLYSVCDGSYEITIADLGQPHGDRGKVIRFVPLPEDWGARDLAWQGAYLYVLATIPRSPDRRVT
jgi:hypothetical protein